MPFYQGLFPHLISPTPLRGSASSSGSASARPAFRPGGSLLLTGIRFSPKGLSGAPSVSRRPGFASAVSGSGCSSAALSSGLPSLAGPSTRSLQVRHPLDQAFRTAALLGMTAHRAALTILADPPTCPARKIISSGASCRPRSGCSLVFWLRHPGEAAAELTTSSFRRLAGGDRVLVASASHRLAAPSGRGVCRRSPMQGALKSESRKAESGATHLWITGKWRITARLVGRVRGCRFVLPRLPPDSCPKPPPPSATPPICKA
jgi:hypothetical protein